MNVGLSLTERRSSFLNKPSTVESRQKPLRQVFGFANLSRDHQPAGIGSAASEGPQKDFRRIRLTHNPNIRWLKTPKSFLLSWLHIAIKAKRCDCLPFSGPIRLRFSPRQYLFRTFLQAGWPALSKHTRTNQHARPVFVVKTRDAAWIHPETVFLLQIIEV